MNNQTKKGFTLLELVIVIIIVGVLASLALPRLFSTVEFSRSTEALSTLASIRGSMERCYVRYADYTNCNTWAELDMDDPTTTPGAHFGYSFPASAATTYTIRATRNTKNGGDGTSQIDLQQTTTDVLRSGTGAFQGI